MRDRHQTARASRPFRMGKRWAAALAITIGPATVAVAGLGSTAASAATPAAAPAGGCPNVELDFSRGSTELPGLGIVGTPLLMQLRADLPGMSVSSWANPYGASITQLTAGPGATDLTQHVVQEAAACPNTTFVLGGYSQGASVVDISLGIPTFLGAGQHIPASLAPRIAAIVTFGNPLRLFLGETIAKASPTYGPKTDEFCNAGDPVCGNGVNIFAHLLYAFNGSVGQAATFAAGKVKAGA